MTSPHDPLPDDSVPRDVAVGCATIVVVGLGIMLAYYLLGGQ
jgi:hypothetical protein